MKKLTLAAIIASISFSTYASQAQQADFELRSYPKRNYRIIRYDNF